MVNSVTLVLSCKRGIKYGIINILSNLMPNWRSIYRHSYWLDLHKVQKNEEETNAVKLGIQALLRSQMIADYNRWSDKGYVPIYARENFENCWRQYHELGANGVMNDIHKKFINLPTSPKKEKNTEKKQENNAKGGS